MTSAATTTIPGYIAGTWDIDTSHSDVSFTVRHMMVSKVRGRFGAFSVLHEDDGGEHPVRGKVDMGQATILVADLLLVGEGDRLQLRKQALTFLAR